MLGSFNEFARSVVLRISEGKDLGDIDRFAFYEATKTLIAAPPDTLRVNPKYLSPHYVLNVIGVIITTNHKVGGLFLPADDRRHSVAWSTVEPSRLRRRYWAKYWGRLNAGGAEAVAEHLRTLHLAGFNPKAPPPHTQAFWEMVNAMRSEEESEMADIIESLGKPKALIIADLVAERGMPAVTSSFNFCRTTGTPGSSPSASKIAATGGSPTRRKGEDDGGSAASGQASMCATNLPTARASRRCGPSPDLMMTRADLCGADGLMGLISLIVSAHPHLFLPNSRDENATQGARAREKARTTSKGISPISPPTPVGGSTNPGRRVERGGHPTPRNSDCLVSGLADGERGSGYGGRKATPEAPRARRCSRSSPNMSKSLLAKVRGYCPRPPDQQRLRERRLAELPRQFALDLWVRNRPSLLRALTRRQEPHDE